MKKIFFLFISLLLGSCGLTSTRPKLELSLATAAIQAARETNAPKFAPQLYRKAEYYFLKARSSYKKKYFNKAKQYAVLSKKFSERAEYISVRKKTLENY